MKRKIKILVVVGARPNFIKIWPLFREFKKHKNIKPVLVHTGQHYDYEMSDLFFKELKMLKPDYNLGVGSHPLQFARIMEKLGRVVLKERPDCVVVVGDVNSTLAGALTSKEACLPVVHIEAGLRSFDHRMPEELNRVLTDHVSNLLFVSDPQAVLNLKKEGISPKKIFYVGNIMIDALKTAMGKIKNNPGILNKLRLEKKNYAVLTLHRAENVDNKSHLQKIFQTIGRLDKNVKIVWPIHPRTEKQLKKFNLFNGIKKTGSIIMTKPLGYMDMICLLNNAKFVITDSGGVQEETTVLGVPCLTMRRNTERPVTVKIGTNIVVNGNKGKIVKEVKKIMAGRAKKGGIPKYWDGNTAERIVRILMENINLIA